MNPQHWLLITGRDSWDIMEQAGAWSFAEKSLRKARSIQPGDRAIVYCTGESVIAAVLEFSATLETGGGTRLFNSLYPHRVRIKKLGTARASVPIQWLVPKLQFVTNKNHWSSHLQGQAIRSLSKADFDTMANALHPVSVTRGVE